jgi:hypothetical protein
MRTVLASGRPSNFVSCHPAEKMWCEAKEFMCDAKARTDEELYNAIGPALKTATPPDAQGWIRSFGRVSTFRCSR